MRNPLQSLGHDCMGSRHRTWPLRVDRPLGAGGMGEVWKARDPRVDRVARSSVSTPSTPSVRAGGSRDCRTESSAHLPALRRRHRLPGDGVRRRASLRGAGARGRRVAAGDADRGGLGRGASQGHRASRSEAGQHSGRRERRKAARLRAGENGRPCTPRRSDDRRRADQARRRSSAPVGVHVAGAGPGASRSTRARTCSLSARCSTSC